jgi:glycosyltransferase involved in cell wall biosynthesis
MVGRAEAQPSEHHPKRTDMTEAPEPEQDPGPAVCVAYVSQNSVGNAWHHCMTELLGLDLVNAARILRGGYIAIRYGTDGLPEARNKAVEEFLARDGVDWLLWLDTDMGFRPDTLERLLAVADPVERPIVGALAFTQRESAADDMGGWRCVPTPTVFDWIREGEKQGFSVRWDYPRDALVRCAGTGSACVLIHRSVFEQVHAKYGRTWYDRSYNPSMQALTSEDLSFCMRAVALGIPVHVHTGVKTTHQKTLWLSEEDYLDTRAPVPATAATAVIVPVLRRPQNAGPFMASLRASTGLATAYAVVDDSDVETALAWKEAGAEVLDFADDDGQSGTFAEKVNAGYRRTQGRAQEPWLFLVGDDVRFHPGWLDHAQEAAGDRYHVVGTNDLFNPRVTSGEHATHLLVRRKYAEGMGASWDGPGVVAHEGYRHWYVDDEIVTAAKQRGVWAPALRSRVEHLHPLAGKANGDEVYELGAQHADADRALFEQRCKEYL